MKKIAFIILAIGFCLGPLNAGATTVDLYNSFPDHQGDNGFYAYKNDDTNYTLLVEHSTIQYYFSDPGGSLPLVFKTTTSPWIAMQPDYTYNPNPPPTYGYGEDAVLAWVVPETNTYHLSGSFWDQYFTADSDIYVYIKQNSIVLFANTIAGSTPGGIPDWPYGTILNFDFTVSLNASDILYFGVNPDGTNSNDWGALSGTIEYTPCVIPLPGTLVLLGSGLLGLGVLRWRRRDS